MKNLKLFILLLTISVVSFSCGSDDDNQDSNDDVLVYGDTEYQLKAGTIEDYGEYSDGVYNFDIVLLSSEISSTGGDPVPNDDTFSGVYFELFTDNADDLAEGTYTFGNYGEVGSYFYADVWINSTLEEYNGFEINSGTFTVLDDGSTYEFEFEGTVDGGSSFSGYYKGALQAFDYSDDDINDRSSRSASSSKRKRESFKK